MPRNTYGGTIYDVAVNASNPAQLALAADGTWPLYDAPSGGTLQTDFLLWNSSTSAYDIVATSITITSGFPPPFQGPNNTELYDAAGHRLPHFDNLVSVGGTGTVTSVNTVTPTSGDVTLTQDDIPDGTTHKQFTAAEATFLGTVPDVTTSFTANVATALADPTATSAVEAIVANYLAANSIYPSLYIGSSDPLPSSAPQGASLDILSGSVTGSIGVSSYVVESQPGSTSVTTTGTAPAALGANAVVLAFVSTSLSTGTGTAPAPLPATFAGLGLTWTQITLPTTHTFNGYNSVALYLGKGTGTTTRPTITFGSAPTNVHLRIGSLANANGTIQQAASTAYATTSTTPTINLPSAVGTGTVTAGWIVQNNATNAQTPGTGYTEIASALSSTGMRTSGAVAVPSLQRMAWTTTSGYQKILVAVEIV